MAYRNKEDQATAGRLWYEKNKEKTLRRSIEANARNRSRNREYVQGVKNVPCADCKQKYPHYVMDFDHTDDNKMHNISTMVNGARSLELIKVEISKCEIVCSNCHRIRTWSRSH